MAMSYCGRGCVFLKNYLLFIITSTIINVRSSPNLTIKKRSVGCLCLASQIDGPEKTLNAKGGIMDAVHACSMEAAVPHPLRLILKISQVLNLQE